VCSSDLTAGATVRHKSAFDNLEHFQSETKIDAAFIKKWVVPFYMFQPNETDKFIADFKKIAPELTIEIAKILLGDFNWRTRIVGAYFTLIKNYTELEDIIGTHLLKSQVCDAGTGYCLTFASFNTKKSLAYLKQYLDYYLSRKELYFDQDSAMAAINYLDRRNGTEIMNDYLPIYEEWVSDKNQPDLNLTIAHFDAKMTQFSKIKHSAF
jgi:hypothetical protein